jgi:hypothetical protein
MKYIVHIVSLLLLFTLSAAAQFRGEEPRPPSLSEQKQSSSSSSLLGFLNSDNFQMRHSLSMSYMTLGNQSVGVSMYTNSMRYSFSENLSARADVSFAFSPFGSFGAQNKNDLSGIFLNRASIDYKPYKDLQISLQYRGYPAGYGNFYQNGSNGVFRPFIGGGQDDW